MITNPDDSQGTTKRRTTKKERAEHIARLYKKLLTNNVRARRRVRQQCVDLLYRRHWEG